jgi:hypothetical protein
MFGHEPASSLHRVPLLSFIEDALCSAHKKEAKRVLDEVSILVPALAKLRMTPQTPPFHTEGVRVEAHLLRMLTVLFAVNERKDLLFIEEFAREKAYALEIQNLLETLVSHKDFFVAYILAHDLAKVPCLTFDAKEGSKGAEEGFILHGERLTETASESERQRYDKLARAYAASHDGLSDEELAAEFYDYSGVHAHYKGHDRVGAGAEFAAAREDILRALHLPLSNAKMLAELIRLHMDVTCSFERKADPLSFEAFTAIALKAGLNKELFWDLAIGAHFLDAVVGSLQYRDGVMSQPVHSFFNFLKAERESAPQRHESRAAEEQRGKKAQVKALLDEGGLSPDAVFTLLRTPIGPVRGEIMKQVYSLVHEPSLTVHFGEQTEEIRQRARKTQALFRERGIPFTL